MDYVIWFGNFREAPPPDEQPEVEIFHWRIIAGQYGDQGEDQDARFLVGYLSEDGITVRITTQLVCLEPASRRITTKSGRRYLLVGPPCTDPARLLVITARVAVARLRNANDVTDEFWAAALRATH